MIKIIKACNLEGVSRTESSPENKKVRQIMGSSAARKI